jgi:hypothetical protein
MSKVKRAILSVVIAGAVSFLPLAQHSLAFFSLLTTPGAMLALLVFGREVQLTSLPARAVCNFIIWMPAVYFFPNMWRWGAHPTRQTPTAAKVLFVVWLVLLVPWLLFAPLSGMAFDAGPSLDAYAFVWSVWLYPVSLAIVAFFRRWVTWIVFLPFMNMVACFVPGLWHK